MVKTKVMDAQGLAMMKDRVERLLSERGVQIHHPALCAALEEKGCLVDGEHVRFPREVIAQAVAAVPKQFTLYSPSGEHDLRFPHPEGGFYTRTNTGAPAYREANGDEHVYRLRDVEEWFTVCNSMENVDYIALPSTSESEVPAEAVDVLTLEKALKISKKHIWIQPYEARNVRCLIEVAQAAAGGADKLREKPFVSFISCSVPLLHFKYMDAEVLYRCAEAGIPVQPCSLPTAGANTPVTAQGTMLVCCAEVLAQIVMLELLCPGLPVIATPLPFSMDMKTTQTLQSCPEITLGRLMCMQLFHEGYGMMAHSYGTGTDSKALDAQNLIERTQLIDMMAMSDADVLGGAGQLDTARTNSPLQLILDNEIFGIAQRMRKGLVVDDEMFDWEELMGDPEELADGFIITDHTLRHYADATRPALFDRGGVLSPERTEGEDPVMARYHEILENPVRMERSAENMAAIDEAVRCAVEILAGKARETV